MLGDHQHRAAPLAAEPEALHEAQRDEQDRGGDADRLVGGQEADRARGQAHHQQRRDEHVAAARAVAEVAGDDAADRPRDEADRVGGEGQQRADQRLGVREEEVAEDERGGRAVEEEVVPLQRGADHTRGDDTAERSPARLHEDRMPARPTRKRGVVPGGPGQCVRRYDPHRRAHADAHGTVHARRGRDRGQAVPGLQDALVLAAAGLGGQRRRPHDHRSRGHLHDRRAGPAAGGHREPVRARRPRRQPAVRRLHAHPVPGRRRRRPPRPPHGDRDRDRVGGRRHAADRPDDGADRLRRAARDHRPRRRPLLLQRPQHDRRAVAVREAQHRDGLRDHGPGDRHHAGDAAGRAADRPRHVAVRRRRRLADAVPGARRRRGG